MKTSTILWGVAAAGAVWWLLSRQKPKTSAPSPRVLAARAKKAGRITVNAAAQRRAEKAAQRARMAA